ncbi:hypothetical protein BY458DRAFT_560719 [Sporodiniella umbellata]|nr:hypothetical protein BY458DRAFT_560719 [Sporodiniella umbellata]
MSHSDLLEEIEELRSEEESICSSVPDENIDFDLVYALHTFVATVEGQASVVKGDALVLMEDTNIYWWLVEVLTTREVGYIPAENIETSYERLARLNKHRNVEVTFPSIHDTLSFTINSQPRVTILDDLDVFHYEVDSEESDSESDKEEEETDEAESMSYVEQTGSEVKETLDIRVFAGNVGGQGFHTFSVTDQTSAEDLLIWAVYQFGVHDECNEYYMAVQGSDGDDYVLSAQDKPLSIFKTLTDSLRTPMPLLSNRISQPSSGRRPRSSSFGNDEQTDHDEDGVIRFYLHRRTKRENMIYIKVSLYLECAKKKAREMDRMDKVIAVTQDAMVGQVIRFALEKFHVPDLLKQYTLSVKKHHKEIELGSNEMMSSVLGKLSSNTITSELVFILRQSRRRKLHFPERRPSILDVLMDTPKHQEEKYINTHPLFRRSSAPEMDRPQDRKKESLRQQFKRLVGWGSNSTSPVSSRKQSLVETKSRQGSADQSSSRFEMISCISEEDNREDSRYPNNETVGPLDRAMKSQEHVIEPPVETLEHTQEPIEESDKPAEEPVESTEATENIEKLQMEPSEDNESVENTEEKECDLEEKEEKEEKEESVPELAVPEKSSDIQEEYTMWINNQPNEEEVSTPLESSMTTSMSTSKVSLVSEVSSSNCPPIPPPVSHTAPVDPSHMDDLYLLVAHGVDFLTARENTQWEQEGGYEFHPWNRPQSSFAVRPKDKKSPQPIPPPPLAPIDEQQKEVAMSMAKRILSGKVEEDAPVETPVTEITPITTTNNIIIANNNTPVSQIKPSLDDEELQRIVAAHIVF